MAVPDAPRPKALLSWSSGKDAAFALDRIRQAGEYEVVGLVTTINSTHGRVAMHAVHEDLLHQQSHAVGLPLWPVPIPWPCPNEVYESAMAETVARAVGEGVTHMIFGDLFLTDIRAYRESQLAGSGVTPVFPIWTADTADLARRMLDSGLRAIVACVDPKQLDPSFAGRQFDGAMLEDLPAGVDPCGENGEFHTFAYDGGAFDQPVDVHCAGTLERDGFVFADLRLGAL
ncbi:MAG TPA: hypothetical protein VNV65_05160 [Candidatus Solibacter sp.]|nr:hypothetical protein [Candidatus Solibacter sp.]